MVKIIFTFVAVVLGLALVRQLYYTVEEVVRKELNKASCVVAAVLYASISEEEPKVTIT